MFNNSDTSSILNVHPTPAPPFRRQEQLPRAPQKTHPAPPAYQRPPSLPLDPKNSTPEERTDSVWNRFSETISNGWNSSLVLFVRRRVEPATSLVVTVINAGNGQLWTNILNFLARGVDALGDGWREFMLFINTLRVLKILSIVFVVPAAVTWLVHHLKELMNDRNRVINLLGALVALGTLIGGIGSFIDGLHLCGAPASIYVAVGPMHGIATIFLSAQLILCLKAYSMGKEAIQELDQNNTPSALMEAPNLDTKQRQANLEELFGIEAAYSPSHTTDWLDREIQTLTALGSQKREATHNLMKSYLNDRNQLQLYKLVATVAYVVGAWMIFFTSYGWQGYLVLMCSSAIMTFQLTQQTRYSRRFIKELAAISK